MRHTKSIGGNGIAKSINKNGVTLAADVRLAPD